MKLKDNLEMPGLNLIQEYEGLRLITQCFCSFNFLKATHHGKMTTLLKPSNTA
jgi:hypothetical protein